MVLVKLINLSMPSQHHWRRSNEKLLIYPGAVLIITCTCLFIREKLFPLWKIHDDKFSVLLQQNDFSYFLLLQFFDYDKAEQILILKRKKVESFFLVLFFMYFSTFHSIIRKQRNVLNEIQIKTETGKLQFLQICNKIS